MLIRKKTCNTQRCRKKLPLRLNITLFIPRFPPNGDEGEPCEVTVVIIESGSVIPSLAPFSSPVLIQLAGEPGWFPAVNKYGMRVLFQVV